MRPIPFLVVWGLMAAPGAALPDVALAQEDGAARQRILGVWTVVLDDAARAEREALELAFADPIPTDAQIAAADLSEDAAALVGMVVGLRRTNPESPFLQGYRAGLAWLRDGSLTITEDTLTLAFGEIRSVRPYTVVDAHPDRLHLVVTGEDGEPEKVTLRVDGAHLRYVETGPNGRETTFRRKGAAADG